MIPEFAKVPFIQNSIVLMLFPPVLAQDLSVMWLGHNFFTNKFTISIGCPFKNSSVYSRMLPLS
jgi:hypothetical protein